MPVVDHGGWRIDFSDDGKGEAVILIHSSVSGNRQWRRLVQDLKDRFRVLAINLFGYGETSPWPGERPQTLADQAGLVQAICKPLVGPLHIVGHSFGGAVAMKLAALLEDRIASLVLLEPNPFYLLAEHDKTAAYEEIRNLRDHVKRFGNDGNWVEVAKRFSDYWAGEGAWSGMTAERRDAFVMSLPPNYHEWDAVMNERTPLSEWRTLTAKTILVCATETKRPIREIALLLREACPHWHSAEIAAGGHMAPLVRPDLVNPIVVQFLDEMADAR